MRKELARIVGQLSCIQLELSQLSDTHTESTTEILCHKLSLASEHAGNTFPSLRTSVVKPFLPLLRQQQPSSVKQGKLCFRAFFATFLLNLQHADTLKYATFTSVYFDHYIWIVLFYQRYCYSYCNFPFLAFLEALPHLCQHVSLDGGDSDSRAVLCALLGLMEDLDPAVRICFSRSVRFLLTETTRNTEQDFLNEVSNSSGRTQMSVLHTHFTQCIIITER